MLFRAVKLIRAKWHAIHVTQHILSICEADKGRELLQTYLDDPAITRMYKELLQKKLFMNYNFCLFNSAFFPSWSVARK